MNKGKLTQGEWLTIEEEEWEFIAQAKGRSGWGHHPYTQNTVRTYQNCNKEFRLRKALLGM